MHKLLALLIVPLMLLSVQAFGQEDSDGKTVTVTGEGVIFNNDQVTAKDKAIDSALRRAVEQAVGTFVKSTTLVENYVTVEDRILAQARGFVKEWKILSEKVEGNVVSVKVQAVVAATKLKNSLDAIQWAVAQKEYPRVMLMIAEQNVGEESYSYWWGNTASTVSMSQVENTLTEELDKVGFVVIDPQVLSGKIQMKDAYKVTSAGMKDEAAIEIAMLTDAQVVIVGTAVATSAGPVMEGSKLLSGQADISLKAINVDNGQVLATGTAHAADAHISKVTAGNNALRKTARKIAGDLIAKLAEKWSSTVGVITLEVKGLNSYDTLLKFETALKNNVRGVKGVSERRMSGEGALLDIYISGKASHLASELSGGVFSDFSLKVVEVTQNLIKVELGG